MIKDPDSFAGRSLEERYGVRDVQLQEINRELGLDLVTDWQPVRKALAEVHVALQKAHQSACSLVSGE